MKKSKLKQTIHEQIKNPKTAEELRSDLQRAKEILNNMKKRTGIS